MAQKEKRVIKAYQEQSLVNETIMTHIIRSRHVIPHTVSTYAYSDRRPTRQDGYERSKG